MVWDASTLRSDVRPPDAHVEVSPDGRHWAVAADRHDGFTVAVGEIGSATPRHTRTFTVERVPTPPAGIIADAFGIAFIDVDDPAVAVLWRGRVYAFAPDAAEPPLLLAPARGGSFLSYDAEANVLWVHTSDVLSAFDLPLREAGETRRAIQPDRIARFPGAREAVPLRGGRMAVRDETTLSIAPSDSDSPAETIVELPRGGSFAISPSGTAALILPEGPKSSTAVTRKIPRGSARANAKRQIGSPAPRRPRRVHTCADRSRSVSHLRSGRTTTAPSRPARHLLLPVSRIAERVPFPRPRSARRETIRETVRVRGLTLDHGD